MLLTPIFISLLLEKPFNPYFGKLETFMKTEGYTLHFATLSVDSKSAEFSYEFKSSNNSKGGVSITISLSPKLIDPKTYTDFREFRQVPYEPTKLDVSSILYAEISKDEARSLHAFTEKGTFSIVLRRHRALEKGSFKELSKNKPNDNVRTLKRISSTLAPELSEASRLIDWGNTKLKSKYPRQ